MRSYGLTNAAPYASAPAVGPAGDIYWNSTLQALYVSDGAAWDKIGPASGDLWTDTGTALTPATATKGITLVGPASNLSQIMLGAMTTKARIATDNAGPAQVHLSLNRDLKTGVQDDATKPSWQLTMEPIGDQFQIFRVPPGGTFTNLLTLSNAGKLILNSTATTSYDLLAGKLSGVVSSVHLGALAPAGWTLRHNSDVATNVLEDTTKPAWAVQVQGSDDTFSIWRAPATTGAPAWARPLMLDNAGQLSLGNTTSSAFVASGVTGTAKVRLGGMSGSAGGRVSLSANRNYVTGVPDDTAWAQWTLDFGADSFNLYRSPPGATHAWTQIFAVDNAGKTSCTLADGIVTRAMTAPGIISGAGNNVSHNFTTTTYNAWVSVITATLTTRGSYVLVMVNPGLIYNSLNTTGVNVHLRVLRDGGITAPNQPGTKLGPAGSTPVPTQVFVDNPPAGGHTYDLQIFMQSGASSSITSLGPGNNNMQLQEIG